MFGSNLKKAAHPDAIGFVNSTVVKSIMEMNSQDIFRRPLAPRYPHARHQLSTSSAKTANNDELRAQLAELKRALEASERSGASAREQMEGVGHAAAAELPSLPAQL